MTQALEKTQPILTNAAKEFIDKIEKPERFLQFMTTVIAQAHTLMIDGKIKEQNNGHYMLTRLIDCIIDPWISNNDNPVDSVSKGLEELYSSGMCEYISTTIDLVMEVLEKNELGLEMKHIFYANALRKLEKHFIAYEQENP